MSTPLISIIVPIYNVEKYLERCLNSLVNQTYKNYEIICVNDGSPDNCDNILSNYEKKYTNIRVVRQENQGLSVARNNGLKQSNGEYILFIDSDDTIHPETLETLHYYIEKNNADIVSFKLKKCSQDNITYDNFNIQDIDNKVILNPIKNINQKKYKIYYNVCTKFYKRSTLDGIDFIPKIHFEDYPHTYAVLAKNPKVVAIDKELYFYFANGTSISHQSSKPQQIKDYHIGINYIYEIYKNKKELKYIQKQLIPNLLKQQLKKCEKANFENKDKMYKAFAIELKELNEKYLLMWYYNKITNLIQYHKIIKEYIRSSGNMDKYRKLVEKRYKKIMKRKLNLDNPKTYNEKMQWLKLYNATPIKTRLADKYLVREWVKETIGEEYLIPLLGVYDKFDEIDFNKLPNRFVIKCNHGSGYNIIVKDKSKLNLRETKEKLNKWMTENFATKGYELHYRDISPKIIIEEYIEPEISNHEIQAWTFDNEVKFISIETVKDAENSERGTFYLDGKHTEFEVTPQHFKRMDEILLIEAFNKVKEITPKMLINVPYVRMDFIEYKGQIKFREMTFTSGSGFSKIEPPLYADILGEWITLPKLAYNIDTGEYYELPKKQKGFLDKILTALLLRS